MLVLRRASLALKLRGGSRQFAGLTESQQAFQLMARSFAKEHIIPAAPGYDVSMQFPQQVFAKAWELGLVNIRVPEAAGGLGLSCMDNVVISEELAYGCTGIQIGIEINTLASMPLIVAGSLEQQKRFLGRLVEAPIQAAYAVTEPGAGSDVAALSTTAVKNADGDYVINGNKMWITNAVRRSASLAKRFRGKANAHHPTGKGSRKLVLRPG